MSPEQRPESAPSNNYLFQLAELVYNIRVEQLKTTGYLCRAEEITSEEEQDAHFDELSRIYRQVHRELGLAWPPPSLDSSA